MTRSWSSGAAADGEPTAQDWAEAAGTINYEIVTRMGPRLPRVLLGGAGLMALAARSAALPAPSASG